MTTQLSHVYLVLVAGILVSIPEIGTCQTPGQTDVKPSVTETPFGKTKDGQDIGLFTLTGPRGIRAKVMEFGAILVSLEVPDRSGQTANIVLGNDTLAPYLARPSSLGATIGRFANRISNARFTLDGVEYRLTANDGANQLHGGPDKCFHKALWKGQTFQEDGEAGVRMTYLSRDGDEGYPGNLTCQVTYSLTKEGDLKLGYQATTDKPTVLNLTNHSYFNLAGAQSRDISGHEVWINASFYTPVGQGLLPTGEILRVDGTFLDFTKPQTIGQGMAKMTGTGIMTTTTSSTAPMARWP
jgi:aldose 1-epimerase